MEQTQAFGVVGTGAETIIKAIKVERVSGKNVVFWDDIKKVFPGIQFVKAGDVVVHCLEDSNGMRCHPHCIKHYPGAVLDVELSAPVGGVQADSHKLKSSLAFSNFLSEFFSSTENDHLQRPTTTPPKLVSDLSVAPKPLAVFESANPQYAVPTIGKPTPIQCGGKAKATLTQRSEMSECLIPQLFIVLPEELTKYDPTNWYKTTFLLHAICECGLHTKTVKSKIRHDLHFVKHEKYLIEEPIEVFKKYGQFLLLMLKWIKSGDSIAGHSIPPLASLAAVELSDSVVPCPVETVAAMIDFSVECIEKLQRTFQTAMPNDSSELNRHKSTQQQLTDYLCNVNGVCGVGLVKLRSLILTREDVNLRKTLYQMTTSKGYSKWVCLGHYLPVYRGLRSQKLRDLIKHSGGTFDEQLGKVDIVLQSIVTAGAFYDALRNSKRVKDLTVYLNWDCVPKDIDEMQDALERSLISNLYVDLRRYQSTCGSHFNSTIEQYKGLYQLLKPTNLKTVHLVLPITICRLSDFRRERPSHLDWLSIELVVKSQDKAKKELRQFAEIRKSGPISVTLYLWDKSIKHSAQALSKALKTNNLSLITLDCWDQTVEEKQEQALFEVIKTNSNQGFLGLWRKAIEGARSKSGAEDLETKSALVTLALWGQAMDEIELRTLSKVLQTDLARTVVDFWSNTIGKKEARTLSEALKSNCTLTTLNLCRNNITYEGAQILFEALGTNSTLTALNLWGSSIMDIGAEMLSKALKINSTLITLDLGDNSIGSKGAIALFEALKTNSSVTSLSLGNNLIDCRGFSFLYKALATNSTLRSLDMSYNQTQPIAVGFRELLSALKINRSLTTLILKGNSAAGFITRTIDKAVGASSTLTVLDLSGNSIGKAEVRALSDALTADLNLINLNLQSNDIEDEGVTALSKALMANTTLKTLNLRSNSIGERGAIALSEVLEYNSTLVTLDLACNSIGEVGAEELSEALKSNTAMTTLDLNSCSIANRGARALSETLQFNSTLATLNLNHNAIGYRGAIALSESLEVNSTLTTLSLEYNAIGESGSLALSEAHSSRSTLTIRYYSQFL